MAIANVEVVRHGNENNLLLIRRFSKRVQGAGVLRYVRGHRYKGRRPSKFKRKMSALKSLKRRAEIMRLVKLGKLPQKSNPR